MREPRPSVSLEGVFELADERLLRRMTSGCCGSTYALCMRWAPETNVVLGCGAQCGPASDARSSSLLSTIDVRVMLDQGNSIRYSFN